MKNAILACFLFIGTCIYAQEANVKNQEDHKKYAGITAKPADSAMYAKTTNPAALKIKAKEGKIAAAPKAVPTPERAKKRSMAAPVKAAPAK